MKLICRDCDEELAFKELDLGKEELIVKPCKFCLDEASDSGHDGGYDSGYDDGYDAGYEKGEEDATPK